MKASIEKQQIKIAIEIFLDVCKMIRTGSLGNKIIGINESMGEVVMELSCNTNNKIQRSALQNIFDVVNEWNELRFGEENPDDIDLN